MPLRLALYQPDMAPNVGAAMRLCACLGLTLDIIEPCGFAWDMRKIDAVALDYGERANVTRHADWDAFWRTRGAGRVALLTTKGAVPYTDFRFRDGDILLAGRESAGVPDAVHSQADARLLIPMAGNARSLNIVTAAAMAAGEALRQIRTV